ncbi:MAG: hypothetical protein GY839_07975 [candidate division Zixibacteria bacterium]|nr:hypothetical protein [candidate division Zixibacteria bacterium]
MKKAVVLVLILIGGISLSFAQLTPAQKEYLEEYKKRQNKSPNSEIEKFVSPDIYQQDFKPGDDPSLEFSPAEKAGEVIESEPNTDEPEQSGMFDPDLKPFGYDIFADADEVFAPGVHELPPDGYTFGPGDHLLVNVWGRVDLGLDLTIDREGKVFIPKVGELVAAGLTLDKFRTKLDKKLGGIYSDYSLSVSYGKLRQISIYVFGEVKRPGGYTVSSLANLLHALYTAGGITANGSLRDIRLVRNTLLKGTFDLYDLLLKGDHNKDLKLLSGDVVYVPVVGPQVSISGEVKRPAIYELTGNETVLAAIELAGGVTPEAFLESISLDRIGPNDSRILRDLNLIDSTIIADNDIPLGDGDKLKVFSIYDIHENLVYLTGHVKHPGRFGITDSMRISELIDNGEQFREKIYTRRADLFRTDDDGTKTLIPISLEDVLAGDLKADIFLESLDSLVIYSHDHVGRKKNVSIHGEVKYPGDYNLYNSMRLSDLIFLAGNLTKQAYKMECELARGKQNQNTEITTVNLEDVLIRGNTEEDYLLEEDDCVFIRQIPNWRPVQTVTVEGEVLFPGLYAIRHKDEKLSDLVSRTGGLTPTAFPEGAIYIRGSIEHRVKQRNLGQIIANTQGIRLDSMGNRVNDQIVNFNPSQLNRIVIDLPEVLKNPGDYNDIVLANSDYIYIPTYPSGVQVIGAVAYNGTISFKKNKKVDYYVGQAGGLSPDGEKSGIRLVHANGKVYYGGKARSCKVELGDAIIVPSKLKQNRDWGRILSTTATIVGSMATTIFIVDRLK